MNNQRTDVRQTPVGTTTTVVNRRDDNDWMKWLLGALAVAALVVIGFFALGGDADVDTNPGSIDIEAPEIDADVDAPDIDVDVDIDPANAEADAG